MTSAAPIQLRPASHVADATAITSSIDELPFSDLYVNLDLEDGSSFYRLGPNPKGESGNRPVPPEYLGHLRFICTQVSNATSLGGVLTVDDMRLRFQKAVMADGYWRAAIRRIPIVVPALSELNLHKDGVVALRQWGRQRGLLLIGGATGAGKTTTAVSILSEYLENLGGVGMTIEDPPEYLLQGPIGTKGGYCDQVCIDGDSEWEHATNTALRWRPRYILYGEIRSPDAAMQALRASTSGHLIIATAHGGSITDTINTVMRHAEIKIGPAARMLMANNLSGVIHQRFGADGPNIDLLSIPQGGQNAEEQLLRKMLADDGDIGQKQQSLKGYIKRFAAAP
jgi:twitching motility protein PilT